MKKYFNSERKAQFLSKKTLTLWIGIHSFILLMSYTEIDFFNSRGRYSTTEFWPFVDFQYCYGGRPSWITAGMDYTEKCKFTGIFSCYDWSEFAFYVGISILIYLLQNMSKNNRQ